MALHVAALFVYLFLAADIAAQEDITGQTFNEYLDEKHKNFSTYVVKIFDNIDKSISRWVKESDNNETDEDETISAIDEFFKSEKFIEETEKSFFRIRLGSLFQSKSSTKFNQKISAQIPLSRTKKSFQLFIDDAEKTTLAVPFQKLAAIQAPKSVLIILHLFTKGLNQNTP